MHLKTLITAALAFSLLGASGLDAETHRKTQKSASTSKRKLSAKKGKKSVRSRRRSVRQMAPTPARYMEIQQALADKGHYSGPVDGVWGAECVDALKRFQAEEHLSPDGKLGALSIIALGLGPQREPLSGQFAGKPESSSSGQ